MRGRNRLVTTEDSLLHDAITFAFEDAQEVEQAAVRMERMERLSACIGRLSPRWRGLLEASLEPGSSYGHLAKAAGMTLEAVRKGLYRVRQALRLCVAGNVEAMP